MRVAIIGGGISGLSAAWFVAAGLPDAEVIVLEASPDVGGKLRLAEVAGISVDVGAEAMLTARPEGVDLLAAVGLEDERLVPLTTSASIFAGGMRHPMPAGTMMGIPGSVDAARDSGLFTSATLATIAGEPARPPLAPLEHDVPVGALVRDRLGDEVVERLVEPLLGGVYAGRADALSLQATMPALAAALASGGSLLDASAAVADRGKRATGSVFTSLSGGLGSLPRALVERGRFEVRRNVTVRAIRRSTTGFVLETGPVPQPALIEADAVVVAVPAAKAARLLTDVSSAAARELAGIETASVAIVTLAFGNTTLPPGSGLLVGAAERVAVKGVTISSQKWPLATGGLTLLRASFGRAGDNVVLQREDDELIALALHDLRPLLGVTASPVDALVTRWGGGLPQYAVGHVERIARVRAAVADVPALAVCGAALDGVGIPACVAAARAAADRVVAELARRGQ